MPRQGCSVPCLSSQWLWWLFMPFFRDWAVPHLNGPSSWLKSFEINFFEIPANQNKIPHWDIWRSDGKEGLWGFLSGTWFIIILCNLWTSFSLSLMTGSGNFKWTFICLLQNNLGQFYNPGTKLFLVVSRVSVKCVWELIVNCGSWSVFQSSFTSHRERTRKKADHRGWWC